LKGVLEAFKSLKRAMHAWDAKLVEGSPELCVPKELPKAEVPEDPLLALKSLIERSEEYWKSYECERVSAPVAYDGKRVVYDPTASEGEVALKLLIAAMFEHYLNHKLEGRLKKMWEVPYLYVLSKVYGRFKALEALRLSFKPEDVFDASALRAAASSKGSTAFEALLFPSQKVKIYVGDEIEIDENFEKLIIERPDLERRLYAFVLLLEAPKFLAFE